MDKPIKKSNVLVDEDDLIATQVYNNEHNDIKKDSKKTKNKIYEELQKKSPNIKELIEEWATINKKNEDESFNIFFDFILKTSGAIGWLGDETNVDVEIKKIGEKTTKNYEGSIFLSKKGKYFKKHVFTFIKNFVINSSTQKIVSILKRLLPFLCTMSSSSFRPFRQSATLISMYLMESLSILINELLKESKKNKKEQIELKKIIESFFNGVFVHRYRDIDSQVRIDCLNGICQCILNCEKIFLEGIYLRYIGWLLSDKNKDVRQAAISAFSLISQHGIKIYSFFERFFERFVEICFYDSVDTIRYFAIDSLVNIQNNGVVSDKNVKELCGLVFDPNIKVRRIAGKFVSQQIQQEKVIQERLYEFKKYSKEKQKEFDLITGGYSFFIVFEQIVLFLRKNYNIKGHFQTYADFLIDALFENLSHIRNYKGMGDILINQMKIGNDFFYYKEVVALFFSACKLCFEVDEKDFLIKKKRKETESKENKQEITTYLLKTIPLLLEKLGNEENPDTVSSLIRCFLLASDSICFEAHRTELKEIINSVSKICMKRSEKIIQDEIGEFIFCFSKKKDFFHDFKEVFEGVENEAYSISKSYLNKFKKEKKNNIKKTENIISFLSCLRKIRALSIEKGFTENNPDIFHDIISFSEGKQEFDDVYQEIIQTMFYKDPKSNFVLKKITKTFTSCSESIFKRLFSFYTLCDFSIITDENTFFEEKNILDSICEIRDNIIEIILQEKNENDENYNYPFYEKQHPFFFHYSAIKIISSIGKLVFMQKISPSFLSPIFKLYGISSNPFCIENYLKASLDFLRKNEIKDISLFISNVINNINIENDTEQDMLFKKFKEILPGKKEMKYIDLHLELIKELQKNICCSEKENIYTFLKKKIYLYEKYFYKELDSESILMLKKNISSIFKIKQNKKGLYSNLVFNLKKIINGEIINEEAISHKTTSNEETFSSESIQNSVENSPFNNMENNKISSQISFASSPLIKKNNG